MSTSSPSPPVTNPSPENLGPQQQAVIAALSNLKWNSYIPHLPQAKQLAFLSLPQREAFFGGAAGGGKSDALLMAALQYVDVPGYSAILFRRTLSELKLPNSLLDRAHNWLAGKPCLYVAGEHTYKFPTVNPDGTPGEPSKIVFAYIGLESAKARYQSAEFQFCGFDEVTNHFEDDYLWMMSRLRKVVCSKHQEKGENGETIYDPTCPECAQKKSVPIRLRSASNPTGVGFDWVKRRFGISPFIDDQGNQVWRSTIPDRPFIPSFIRDNAFLDQKAYEDSLEELDPITRKQLKYGDWGASQEARFKDYWFEKTRWSRRGDYYCLGPNGSGKSFLPNEFQRIFACVDSAASSKEGPGDTKHYTNINESWTVIGVFGLTQDYNLMWLDNTRVRVEAPDITKILKSVYRKWRPVYFLMEASGLGKPIYQYAMKSGLPVRPLYPHHDKVARAVDATTRAEQGRIWLPQSGANLATWLPLLETELFSWTGHPRQVDDQIDVLSYAAMDVSWEACQLENDIDYSAQGEEVQMNPDLPGVIMPTGEFFSRGIIDSKW